MEIIKSLIVPNERKILLIVLDGLGGLPKNGKTELEAARTPNLDNLAKRSILGLTIPVNYGITPGSVPGHLALFGYDPIKYPVGRGVIEALGVGLSLHPDDLCIRGNFATFKNGVIVDRRAGRISTEENRRLCELLQSNIRRISNTKIIIRSSEGHRFAIVMRGEGLSTYVSESDPLRSDEEPREIKPLRDEAKKTAEMLKELKDRALELLKSEERANYILLRGYSKFPSLEPMSTFYKLDPACIATYPCYRGIGKLVGMEILQAKTWEEEIEVLKSSFNDFDFFYLHFKETDTKGEDGDFEGKIELIEKFDRLLEKILKLKFDVIAIGSDHSTPALLKGHSWHPSPFLLYSPYVRSDGAEKFSERSCKKGGLGIFPALGVMPLLLAHSLKLKKFGA